MRNIYNMLFRTLALVLAMSVGLTGVAAASVNHTSHCVTATERADTEHNRLDIQNKDGNHSHVVAEVETSDVGTTDCVPHYCSAVLIGLVECGFGSHLAMLVVVPEPADLRPSARFLGLYRPPSL